MIASELTLHVASFDQLDVHTLYALLKLRVDVFVVEQRDPYPELDDRDTEPGTLHLWLARDGVPVAYMRLLEDDANTVRIGRMVVTPAARSARNLAGDLWRLALNHVGERRCVGHAQHRLLRHYERYGFTATSPIHSAGHIPHVWVERPAGPLPVRRPRLTERLRLEPISPEHTEDLRRLHQDPVIAHWYAGTWTHDDASGYAENAARAWREDGVHKWIAYDRLTGDLVGRGGLSYADVDGVRGLEIGWAVGSDHHGKGYASEIGRAGLRVAFDELGADHVSAFTERHNAPSRAVMERLGMRYVREFRAAGLIEGKDGVHDDAPFALYRAYQR